MDLYMVVLRVVHIVAGAFWFGSAVAFAFFIEPTAAQVGASAGPFMQHLTQKKKFPIVIAITSVVAIAAGALLYWRDSDGLKSGWMSTPSGIGFSVGAVAAIAAWIVGFAVLRPGIDRLAAAAAAGAIDDVEQIQHRLKVGSVFNVGLLFVTVGAMAAARYL